MSEHISELECGRGQFEAVHRITEECDGEMRLEATGVIFAEMPTTRR
jgi:hypothetical protein